jgi:hypothetical protein
VFRISISARIVPPLVVTIISCELGDRETPGAGGVSSDLGWRLESGKGVLEMAVKSCH